MEVSQVFEPDNLRRALDAYADLSRKANWPITEHFRMYNAAKAAADPASPRDVRFRYFSEWYQVLIKWPGYQRGGGVASVESAFRLIDEFGSGILCITLPLMAQTSLRRQITEALPPFRQLKTNKRYPWMAASKSLHFVNPRLMPKWDGQYVWSAVMYGCFKTHYVEFCRRNSYPPDDQTAGAEFLSENYMHWAADALQRADPDYMNIFSSWYREQVEGITDEHCVLSEIDTYSAVAFEYGVIGEAHRLNYC